MKYTAALILVLLTFSVHGQYISGKYGPQPPSLQDPIAIGWARFLKGGLHYATDKTSLFSIPANQRDTGMFVYVRSTDSLYTLVGSSLDDINWLPVLKIHQTGYPSGAILVGGSDGRIGYKTKFLFYDSTNVSVGFGTQIPTADLEVQQHTPIRTFRGVLSSNYSSNSSGSLFSLKKARGTEAVPTAVVSTDNLGGVYSYGYDGSSFINSGQINFKVDSTVSTGSIPTSIRFSSGKTGVTDVLTVYYKGNVGIGTTVPNSSALLDLTSISMGVLLPRLTTTQRDAIVSPATGLLIYNLTTDAFNFYHSGWIALTSSSGITSLNGLTGATQTFATGTSGTDFAISSSGTTHTFNLPTASASNRGVLSSTDWSTFNSKESALTFSTGLTRATNTITNNLSTGVSGGQTVIGGTASGNNLTYSSTSNATKGFHYWGSSAKMSFDETNARLGIGIATPSYDLDISKTSANGQVVVSVTNLSTASGNTYSGTRYNNAGSSYGLIFKAGTGYTTYKSVAANDWGFYCNAGSGNMAFINDGGNVNFLSGGGAAAQMTLQTSGSLTIGTTTDAASSVLNVVSTTKGFLMPRMTTTQRDAISSPATGLQVYNTTINNENIYDGTRWNQTPKTLTGSATLDFASTAAQTSSELTITVTGAADGDVVSVSPLNAAYNANSNYTARVSSANTVSVAFNNFSAGAIDPASAVFKVVVFK